MNTPPSKELSSDSPLPGGCAVAKTSGLAIASLALGICGFLILPAVAGLACGLIAHGRIRRSHGQMKGEGVALAGIIVSALMLAVFPLIAIVAGLTLPALAKAKSKAQIIMNMSNVRQLCLGVVLYTDDHAETFPPAEKWCDTIMSNVGSPAVFRRPNDPDGARCGYGYNARIAGLKSSEVNKQTILVFELEKPGWNLSGGPELLRHISSSRNPVVVGFADGHAEAVNRERLAQLRWDP